MEEEADPWATDDAAPEGEGAVEGGTPAESAPAAATPAAKTADGKVKYDWRAANLPKAPLPQYTLHWVRPLYLNYRYNMDYR